MEQYEYDPTETVAQVIHNRLGLIYDDDFDAAHAELREHLDGEAIDGLLSGESENLSVDDILDVEALLSFIPGSLGMVMRPTSAEVMRHAISQAVEQLAVDDGDDECPDCYALCSGRTAESLAQMSVNELHHLLCAFADHMIDSDGSVGHAQFSVDNGDEFLLEGHEVELVKSLRELPDSSREKVLEFIERERARLGFAPGAFTSLWEELDGRARLIISELAAHDEHMMTERDLSEVTGIALEDLAAAEATIMRICARMLGGSPRCFPELPLTKAITSGRVHYRLSTHAAAVVRAAHSSQAGD